MNDVRDTIEKLIKSGVPNTLMDNLYTPLTWAIAEDDGALVEKLLQNSVDINLKDGIYGMSPIMWAAYKNNTPILKRLIEAGADLNVRVNVNYKDEYVHPDNSTSKDQWDILQVAANSEAVGALTYLYDVCHFSIDSILPNSNTAETLLMFSIWKKKIETMKFLLSRGASIKKRTDAGDTILLIAISNNAIDIIEELFSDEYSEKGIFNIEEIIEKPNLTSMNPMLLAAEKGQTRTLELLIKKGASLNYRNLSGRTPLMISAFQGNLESVRLLTEKGAEIDSRDFSDNTALLCAADMIFGKGSIDVVEYLLQNGARPDVVNNQNHSLLMWAAKKGHANLVHRLLSLGVDPTVTTDRGWTARKYAMEWDHADIVEMIDAFHNNEAEISIKVSINKEKDLAEVRDGDHVDLGVISKEDVALSDFYIYNFGSVDLIIKKLDFFSVSNANIFELDATNTASIIAPGKGTSFKFMFIPKKDTADGYYDSNIIIESNDPNESSIKIRISSGVKCN